ncbi:MAG: polysaccharide pyruvyl transferase family protein [Eubacterium sp.]|nr:polysaccharide pyruvyl transferase family protein [Eubacterium sp.]
MENRAIIFNTNIGSYNLGDNIICNSAKKELSNILNDYLCVDFPTHTPLFEIWQMTKRSGRYKAFSSFNLKLLFGTNIFTKNLFKPWPNFNLNVFNKHLYKDTVMVGVGSASGILNANNFTKYLYREILSKQYIHSTRDEITKKFIESLGSEYKAINTGCPTMWSLTEEHCKQIPIKKSDSVVFTLTNNESDVESDKKLISLLLDCYKHLYFVPQSIGDIEYLEKINSKKNINILPSDIEAVGQFYENNDVDYVGSRLHGGIYAMQNKKRSIILSVDNRASDIAENYNINCIERSNLDAIYIKINSEFDTKINININLINEWKSQFKD